MTAPARYASVAVAGPMRQTYTYELPKQLGTLSPGQRILAPFGRKRIAGFFLDETSKPKDIETRNIARVLDERSYFSRELFDLCLWMADYYFCNPADCLLAALPSTVRNTQRPRYRWAQSPGLFPEVHGVRVETGKMLSEASLRKLHSQGKSVWQQLIDDGVVVEEWMEGGVDEKKHLIGFRLTSPDLSGLSSDRSTSRLPAFDGVKSRMELKSLGWSDHFIRKAIAQGVLSSEYAAPEGALDFIKGRPEVASIALNSEQQAAVTTVSAALGGGFRTFLLHGITGSGKTIIYCHLARELTRSCRTTLVLTPEIALSGATLAYFRGFFGDTVTVLHSAMTERERLESWQGIRNGKYQMVVGPRSALFAPLPNIGLIIVDEEHDGSYKQDDPAPRFHGRDSAIMRAKINNIPVLLGSASPSLESYHHAHEGRYTLLKLTHRPGPAVLPTVRVIDMRDQRVRGDLPFVSLALKKTVEERLKAGEQIILFLNRRGYAPSVKCSDCGHTPECPACKLQLTYHKVGKKLVCHYCGYVRSGYDVCEKCSGGSFVFLGAGTQKVEEAIPRLFDNASTIRLDSDSASGRQNAHRILDSFAHRDHQILLGTQMVTKGLDLPDVSLVGVLSADLGADLPDFRAAEKTFSRLLQVAGRSGRAEKKGEVLIQTYSPDSPHIVDAARQDYEGFFAREIESRKEGSYPPYVRLVNVVLSGPDEDQVTQVALDFTRRLKEAIQRSDLSAAVLGPAPCPLYHLRLTYRRHILLKTRQTMKLTRLLTEWECRESRFKLPARVKIVIDIDPDDMM